MEQYHILKRIGEGAHGVVLKAKHLKVHRNAIETIPQDKPFCGVTDWGVSGTEESPTEETR